MRHALISMAIISPHQFTGSLVSPLFSFFIEPWLIISFLLLLPTIDLPGCLQNIPPQWARKRSVLDSDDFHDLMQDTYDSKIYGFIYEGVSVRLYHFFVLSIFDLPSTLSVIVNQLCTCAFMSLLFTVFAFCFVFLV